MASHAARASRFMATHCRLESSNHMETLTRGQRAGIVAALVSLMLLGGLMARAAGAGNPSAPHRAALTTLGTATASATVTVGRAVVVAHSASAPTATATIAPTPTVGTTPTVGATPTATATTAPTPTDTPTPAPTWHTVASYSGNSAGTQGATVTLGAQSRILWTCTAPSGAWNLEVAFAATTGGGQFTPGATTCDATHTSGEWDIQPAALTYQVNVGSDPNMGAWTLTVQVYS